MVTVRDLEGSVLRRIGPREHTLVYQSVVINGTGLDAQGNLYMVGSFTDTLYFSPDVFLAPSRFWYSPHPSPVVFVASYAPNGTVRWAQQIGDDRIKLIGGSYHEWGKPAVDVDAGGNMVLGIGLWSSDELPAAFSAAEDGRALAWYDSDGMLQQVQTLEDLGISYEPSYNELRIDPVRRGQGTVAAETYVPTPTILRHDNNGNLYAVWVKDAVRDRSNSVTVSDTTFYNRGKRYIYVLTKFDAQAALLWARNFEYDSYLNLEGIEATEEGHVYVYESFTGKYLVLGDVELTQDEERRSDGFVVHYDENGRFVRALHAAGPGDQSVDVLAFGPADDVYIAGRYYYVDMAVIGADTLYAKGASSMFVAKYGATSLSPEP